MAGFVVHEREAASRREPGATLEERVPVETGHLVQRVLRFGPGRSPELRLEGRHDVLYVASGRGTLLLEGAEHELEPELGVYVAPGETYVVDNPGPEDVVLVSVTAPGESHDAARRRVTVRFADQPVQHAKPDREFRYLVNQDSGCLDVTQFVGLIPPGKAPLHSHTYDEIVYVLEGEGVLHLDGAETPLEPGSCLHLPPLQEHCLENTGPTPMRVLGVFHPSGDPASRAA